MNLQGVKKNKNQNPLYVPIIVVSITVKENVSSLILRILRGLIRITQAFMQF